MGELITELAKQGIGFIVAGVFFYLFMMERKAHAKTSDAVILLSTDSIKASSESTAAVAAMTKVLDSVNARIR